MTTDPVTLGERYTDQITGFVGVATSRTEYLYGCVRVCLEGPGTGGKPEEIFVDEQRLRTADGTTPKPTATSGGGTDAPRTGLRA